MPPSKAAKILARHQENRIAYDPAARVWLKYTGTHWTDLNDEAAFILVDTLVEEGAGALGYGPGYVRSILDLLKSRLVAERFDAALNLIPFRNGILNLDTKELYPHAPGFRLTWCLPFDYDPNATCEPVIAWMHECVGGDPLQVELLRAYLKAVLTGRCDFQRYLEPIGPGASGKGTFGGLAVAIVGIENAHITTLKRLETGVTSRARLRSSGFE